MEEVGVCGNELRVVIVGTRNIDRIIYSLTRFTHSTFFALCFGSSHFELVQREDLQLRGLQRQFL